MKILIFFTAVILLAGCNNQSKLQGQQIEPRPTGLVKLLEDDTGGMYADMRNISSYQGNTRLRRFSLINNYIDARRVQTDPPVYIASSTVINVVNCDTKMRAQFERIYFSRYWGDGDVIAKRSSVGQWEVFPAESLIGIVASAACSIDATHLKSELSRDTRPSLLGEFN
nr:surface-adhesin E family protein [Pantoea sp. 201603H]